jgi:dihydrofolate synthase/folylpolyglutamate synthase
LRRILRNFVGLARCIIAVSIPLQDKSMAPHEIVELARGIDLPAQSAANVASALAEVRLLGLASPPRVLITGSLYLAGAVLAANGTPPT